MSFDFRALIQQLTSLEESSKLAQAREKEEMEKDLYFRLEATADIPRVRLTFAQQQELDCILQHSETKLDKDEYVIWVRQSDNSWLFLTNYGVMIHPECSTSGKRKRSQQELRLMLEILDGTIRQYYSQESPPVANWENVVSFVSAYNSSILPSDDYSDLLYDEFRKYQQKNQELERRERELYDREQAALADLAEAREIMAKYTGAKDGEHDPLMDI